MRIARLWIAPIASVCFPQAMVPNNRTIFKNWSDDGDIPDSNSVSRKTSALKPFKVAHTSISSGANIVNVQIPRQVITNVNSKEFKPGETFYWHVNIEYI